MGRVCLLVIGVLLFVRAMPADFEALKSLCVRETAFDYCGLDAIVNSNMVGHSDRELRALLTANCAYYDFRDRFQNALEDAERVHCRLEVLASKPEAKNIRTMLCALREAAKVDNSIWLLLNNGIERVQYMMGRLISKNSLEEEMISEILPEEVFIPPVKKIHNDYYQNIRMFRNLLVVSCRIRHFFAHNGRLPINLSEINVTKGLFGIKDSMRLSYAVRKNEWQLRYIGPNVRQEILRFNVYIPTLRMGDLQKWPYAGCVSYSYDYEYKRKVLYTLGGLYEHDSIWKCRFQNGRIVRSSAE